MWKLDLDTNKFEKVAFQGKFGERAGHSATIMNDGNICIYGGWNAKIQYNDMMMYSIEKEEWLEMEI